MIFTVLHHWMHIAPRVDIFAFHFTLLLAHEKMPVFCIAYGCDNDKQSAPEGTSFHRLPLKKLSLLKQVRIVLILNIVYVCTATLTVAKQPSVEGSSYI